MYSIKRDIETIAGQILTQELMEHPDGRTMFRWHFERSGFTSLSFESYKDLLTYLDSKCSDSPKMLIADGKLWYQLSESDRELCYFGDICEE